MIQKLSKISYRIFVTAVIVIALLLLATLFPIEGNYQIRIVQSGSMSPAIKTGSIVVIKPVENYKIGDAITFLGSDRDQTPTTHRIVESRIQSGETVFRVKGDANEDPDSREVRQSEVIGKVFFSVPFVGYIIDMARKPIGFIVLIIVPALVVIYDEIHKIWREMKKIRDKRRSSNTPPEEKGDTL